MLRWKIAGLLSLSAGIAMAQDVPDAPAPPPPPIPEPLPPKIQDQDDQIQPQVVIRQEDGRTVEEYSVGGVVYMVKVTPDAGPAYYLIDTTGDGDFDSRHEHMEPVRPAHWKIIQW
ncbi:MAG: DUF2782 domain-containing protein [Wenzhouxiangella sp.]|jgi:hypothetical protein|nr:DUF2782 domain-containing protein [Wenzhouxiangella sp.]